CCADRAARLTLCGTLRWIVASVVLRQAQTWNGEYRHRPRAPSRLKHLRSDTPRTVHLLPPLGHVRQRDPTPSTARAAPNRGQQRNAPKRWGQREIYAACLQAHLVWPQPAVTWVANLCMSTAVGGKGASPSVVI